MLAESTTVDLNYDDDEWLAPPNPTLLYRSASVGNSWGVTSIGRGFDWTKKDDAPEISPASDLLQESKSATEYHVPDFAKEERSRPSIATPPSLSISSITIHSPSRPPMNRVVSEPLTTSPTCAHIPDTPATEPPSRSHSKSPLVPARALTPLSVKSVNGIDTIRPPLSRSPTSRPRRRSSQQRVSLIAGRVLIAPIEPPSPPPTMPQILHRTSSTSSLLSSATSTGPPTPAPEHESFLGGRTISDFFIEGEIGRGAYGLVKRAREYRADRSLGPPLVIKQIIKSRILADCWKRHPRFGTIPIEIFVMSAISSTSFALPPKRPWDPSRLKRPPSPNTWSDLDAQGGENSGSEWQEGKVVIGHPNICPLLDFFEDNHYYYLVLPSSAPERSSGESPPPTDLFDLVEAYPQGLPPSSIRSYLGQLADALCFLHLQGIVHRDVKDENVVLGPDGKCVLIDFGSSGLIKKNGWDTFSGTLDYAGPEILRGERYHGKEQDVWAFGVVAYVLLVGECPFVTAAEAQEGLESPFANASIALDERCGDDTAVKDGSR